MGYRPDLSFIPASKMVDEKITVVWSEACRDLWSCGAAHKTKTFSRHQMVKNTPHRIGQIVSDKYHLLTHEMGAGFLCECNDPPCKAHTLWKKVDTITVASCGLCLLSSWKPISLYTRQPHRSLWISDLGGSHSADQYRDQHSNILVE